MKVRNTTLDDVAAVVGFSATLRLSAWYGDVANVYVPERVEAEQVLVRLIGMSAARRLSEAFGGEWLALPTLSSYETDKRRRVIARMVQGEFSPREIAIYMRMSARRVQQIIKELESVGLIEGRRVKKTDEKEDEKTLVNVWATPVEKPARKTTRKKTPEKSV